MTGTSSSQPINSPGPSPFGVGITAVYRALELINANIVLLPSNSIYIMHVNLGYIIIMLCVIMGIF